MDDLRVGAALRAVRLRRRFRQSDVAAAAGVHRSTVSRVERGHAGSLSLDTVRRLAAALDMRIDVLPRWRGGELDRLLNAEHSALHESVARSFARLSSWQVVPEATFAIYGERGAIDVLAWHAASRSVLIIELKTAVVDVQELVATMDRKVRLAATVARERGWDAAGVSGWVVIADTRTNRRRVAAHEALLRSVYPLGGRAMRQWLRRPGGRIAALSFWSDAHPGHASRSTDRPQRVRGRREGLRERGSEPDLPDYQGPRPDRTG